jgi:DNA repair exonuclease SbcCD nuclease subunit
MKILSSADWHINLRKKKIPYDWQINRFKLMFKALDALQAKESCDVHVISGDLFDEIPSTDETALIMSYLNSVTIPTIVIGGNHEATTKGKTFWSHFKMDKAVNNKLVHISVENERINIAGQYFQTFPYGSVQTDNLPQAHGGDILVTHIRGEVPPHITPEYDFERLRPWGLVLLGDLHFNHKYQDYSIYYPGSPINTTFDRTNNNKYGVDVIDFTSIDNYTTKFVDLKLPKLLRKTIKVGDAMEKDPIDHVIYELTGSIDELALVQKTDLLDKKLVTKSTEGSTLNLKEKNIVEELEIYLDYLKVANSEAVIKRFKDLGLK